MRKQILNMSIEVTVWHWCFADKKFQQIEKLQPGDKSLGLKTTSIDLDKA